MLLIQEISPVFSPRSENGNGLEILTQNPNELVFEIRTGFNPKSLFSALGLIWDQYDIIITDTRY